MGGDIYGSNIREKKNTWTAPKRKLSEKEIEEILANWVYDPDYYDDDDDDSDVPAPLWDEYGNPTRESLDAMYEARHEIGYVMTVSEAIAEIHEACN